MRKKLILIKHGDGPTDDRVVSWACVNSLDVKICKPFKVYFNKVFDKIDE